MQREYEVLQRKSSGTNQEYDAEHFSEFSNKSKHNRKMPSRNYLVDMCKQFHCSIRNQLVQEVKKRSANSLYWDAFYKESKRLAHCNDQSVFKGLVTGTNELGKVRVQFHVVVDAHDQIGPTIDAHKNICNLYG